MREFVGLKVTDRSRINNNEPDRVRPVCRSNSGDILGLSPPDNPPFIHCAQILLYATSVLSFVQNKSGVTAEIVKVTRWGKLMAPNHPNVGNIFGPRQYALFSAVPFPSMEYYNLYQIASRDYTPQKKNGINR